MMTRDEQIARAAIEACAKVCAEEMAEWHIDRDGWQSAKDCRGSILELDPAAIVASVPQSVESPEFSDSARDAITWVLYHHQGGNSPIGQPLRLVLGLGQHERIPSDWVDAAKWWADSIGAKTEHFHAGKQAPPATSSDAPEMPEPVAYRYTSSRTGRMWNAWHYQKQFPDHKNRRVKEIGKLEQLYTADQLAERDRQWQALLEKDQKDAARYRWLRDTRASEWAICQWGEDEEGYGHYADCRLIQPFDALVDAALAQEQGR